MRINHGATTQPEQKENINFPLIIIGTITNKKSNTLHLSLIKR